MVYDVLVALLHFPRLVDPRRHSDDFLGLEQARAVIKLHLPWPHGLQVVTGQSGHEGDAQLDASINEPGINAKGHATYGRRGAEGDEGNVEGLDDADDDGVGGVIDAEGDGSMPCDSEDHSLGHKSPS